jgi:hypothetical protein
MKFRIIPAAGGQLNYVSSSFTLLSVRTWFRATYDATTGDAKFFTADGNLEAPAISDYVQLGTTQNSGAAAIAVTTTPFFAGTWGGAPSSYPFDGDIYRSQVFNEIDGTTPVVDFDFGDYVSGSTWTGIPYGPELITTPYTASNWTAEGSNTIADVNTATGEVLVSYVDDPNGAVLNLGALLPELLTTGKSFSLSGEAKVNTGTVGIRLNNETPAVSMVITSTTYVPFEAVTAYDGTGTLSLDFTSMGAGETISVKNLSIKLVQVFTLEGNASIFQPPVDASGPFGYLAEKASTNLIIQSEDFTTSWNTNAATVVANAAVAPDGTTTMDRLAVTTASGVHGVYQNQSLAAGTNYTASVYMKNDGSGFGGICIGSGNDLSVVVDLSTGLVTDTHTTGTGVLVAYGCDDVGNGIYRVWVSGNSSAPDYIIPFSSDAAVPSLWENGRPRYTGVAGEDILIWGAQAELGTYPTSYIATTTTAVTRNADVLIAGDMVTDAAGSGYAEASSIWGTQSPSGYILGRTYLGRLLYGYVSTQIQATEGTNVPASPIGTSYQNRPAPMASTWGNNLTVYKDGAGGTAASYIGTMGTGNLGIGNNNGSAQQWNGTIREVKIFNSELTAEEVGDL